MKERTARDWLERIVIGGLFGWVLQLFIASAAASFFGGWYWAFSLLIIGWNTALPRDAADILATALMFLIGAEIGLATLPYADYGAKHRPAALLHLAATLLTVAALGWVLGGAWGILYWLVPAALIYVLIWLGRWAGWYAELEQIKEKLGIAPEKPSPLKWRETLPHIGYAFLLCAALPLVLRALDPVDIPLLSTLLAWLLMLVCGFVTGLSLGKRQGFCPLYSLACGVFSLAIFPFALSDLWLYPFCAFFPALLGNLLGWAGRRTKKEENPQ